VIKLRYSIDKNRLRIVHSYLKEFKHFPKNISNPGFKWYKSTERKTDLFLLKKPI